MPKAQSYNGMHVLLAASIVSAVLGSIHAFSVFLGPLETQFSASRSVVSLTYSLALVALTFAVLLGPRIYGRCSGAKFMFAACTMAALGALLAGIAGSLASVWVGYSLIFGVANGLGYGFGLQISAQANQGREGLALGVVSAAYAFGAVISPALFDRVIGLHGFQGAMFYLSAVLLAAGCVSALLMMRAKARYTAGEMRISSGYPSIRNQILLWISYFGGVLAGLMVISQAAGIAVTLQPETKIWLAPMMVAACNLLGSLVVGHWVDRIVSGPLLAGLAVVTALSLFGLTAYDVVGGMLLSFGFIGFAYGGTIAAYPAVIAKQYGMDNSARIYGRIFTAWGCAGLFGPWFAGALYNFGGDYQLALMTAAALSMVSAIVAMILLGTHKPSAG